MNSPSRNGRDSGRRPYWLLLVLALFLAGQAASAGHWHDSANTADHDCALCVLSSAGGAALQSSGWQPLAIALCAFTAYFFLTSLRRGAVRFHDSRAPPALPGFNV